MTETKTSLKAEFLAAQEAGQLPILIQWDPKTSQAISHPNGWQEMTEHEYQEGFNAMAVRPNDNFTFIDIDCKNTSTGSAEDLKNYILILLQEKIPYDILRKVYIEQTRSNGLHILMRYKAPEQKFVIASGPKGEELIALYRAKSLCYTYPTPGYTPVMGSRDDIEELTRENVSLFANVLKVLDEPKEKKAVAASPSKPIVDRPPFWSLFDRQVSDSVFIELLEKMGLTRCDQQPRHKKDAAPYEAWRRKESASPMISAKVFLGKEPKVLLFTSSMPQFPSYHTHSKLGDWSLTASKIIYYLHDQNHEEANMVIEQLAEQDGISLDYVVTASGNVVERNTFWEEDKKGIKFVTDAVIAVLRDANFYRFGDDFVKVTDNVVSIVTVETGILPYLCEIAEANSVVAGNLVSQKIKGFLNTAVVLERLPEFDTSKMLRDTDSQVWRFFRNCAVRITPEFVEPVAYHQLDGYIWKNHILDRDFTTCRFDDLDAYDFIKRLAGDGKESILMGLLGYNCTRYNQADNARLTLILEDIEEEMEGSSEGGSGKSLLAQFPKYACGGQVFVDGKSVNRFQSDFAWQRITPDVRTILVDDVDRRVKIDWFFALTTGDFVVNRKNRDEMVIPFEDKPKMIITSNYAIGDSTFSVNRRLYSFSVQKVFDDTNQPRDLYGRLFFIDYTADDWAKFDNMINECVRHFLRGALKGLKVDDTTKRRQLVNNTDSEFINYMDSQLATNFFDWAPLDLKDARHVRPDGSVTTNAVNIEKWIVNGGKGKYAIFMRKEQLLTIMKNMGLGHLTMKTLTKWVMQWAKSRNVGIDPDYRVRVLKDPNGYGSGEELARTYCITSLPI